MDALHYARVASAGWLFLGVFCLALWDARAKEWLDFLEFLKTAAPQPLAAVIAAAASLSGPPVFGFLMERVVTLALIPTGWDLWKYPCNRDIGKMLEEKSGVTLPAGTGTLHALFYTFGDARLIEWVRRRTTQIYSSVAAMFSMILAVIFAGVNFGYFSLPVTVAVVVMSALLVLYCVYVNRAVMGCLAVWVNTLGRLHVDEMYSEGDGVEGGKKEKPGIRSRKGKGTAEKAGAQPKASTGQSRATRATAG